LSSQLVDFDPQQLKAEAQRRTGFSDFGDPDHEEPFRILCHALAMEAGLTPQGRVQAVERVVQRLMERLLMEGWFRRYPEIADEQITAPLIIAGLPRTGTTMLYRMLAAADGFAAPLFYEVSQPPPAVDWDFRPQSDTRIAAAEAAVAAMMATMPELASIYPFEAMAPEESIFLYGPSFRTTREQSYAHVPSFDRWFRTADKRPAYTYLKRALQLLQWHRRRSGRWIDGKRWLLKTPDHLHGLQELLEVFAGAQVIQTHRDPLQTIPSICSFIRVLHRPAIANDDSREIGRAWSDMFAASMQQVLEVRARHPDRFLDVWYRETVEAPRKVAEDVFAFIRQPLSESVWGEMEKWREANKREQRPLHHYTLEEFGLSENQIKQQFSAYRERFITRGARDS